MIDRKPTENAIEQYRQYTLAPWGKFFYRLLHEQLNREILAVGEKRTCLILLTSAVNSGLRLNIYAAVIR